MGWSRSSGQFQPSDVLRPVPPGLGKSSQLRALESARLVRFAAEFCIRYNASTGPPVRST